MSRVSPETIDRQEEIRVEKLRAKARKRGVMRLSDRPFDRKREGKWRNHSVNLHLSTRGVGLTPAGIVDVIQKNMAARQMAIALQDPGIVHVRNHKPLTEHGARLLGVPWDGTP